MTDEEFIRWVSFEMRKRFGDKIQMDVYQDDRDFKFHLEFKRGPDNTWSIGK